MDLSVCLSGYSNTGELEGLHSADFILQTNRMKNNQVVYMWAMIFFGTFSKAEDFCLFLCLGFFFKLFENYLFYSTHRSVAIRIKLTVSHCYRHYIPVGINNKVRYKLGHQSSHFETGGSSITTNKKDLFVYQDFICKKV